MIDLTTIVAVDAAHVAELRLVWSTWIYHRPELLEQPMILMCDGDASLVTWERELEFLEHSERRLVLWQLPLVSQREKMLSSLVYGAADHVQTPWYLKLDTDTLALACDDWLDDRWFQPDEHNRSPAFVSSPWRYTKPADAIVKLDAWGDGVPELADFPRLELRPEDGASAIAHSRIISWCFYGNTAWTRQMSHLAPGRLPIPSHDTYLWYCAARRGEYYRSIRMARHGWQHRCGIGNLRLAVQESLASSFKDPAKQVLALLAPWKDRPLQGAELGVLRGATSRKLLAGLPNLQLFMVDTWTVPASNSDYARSGDGAAAQTQLAHDDNMGKAIQLSEFARDRRTILRCATTNAAAQVRDNSLDFVYIDADHTYDGVRRDISHWWPKVKAGGLLCGHDYGHPRDRRHLWGVSRAVDNFAASQHLDVQVHESTVWWIWKPQFGAFPESVDETSTFHASSPRVSPPANNGIIYLLTGVGHAARLVVSLYSLRRFFAGKILLLTTRPESHEIGRLCASDPRLAIEHQFYPEVESRRNSSLLTKVRLLQDSPFDVTTFLDADTLIANTIDELLDLKRGEELLVTRFGEWLTSGRTMQKRLLRWSGIHPPANAIKPLSELITDALLPQPAINIGVFTVARDASVLRFWFDLAYAGRNTFICDEIALQLVIRHFRHRVLDCRFNSSTTHSVKTSDVRIWHFHGDKHLTNPFSYDLWWPVFKECMQHNIGGIRDWAPAQDSTLARLIVNKKSCIRDET